MGDPTSPAVRLRLLSSLAREAGGLAPGKKVGKKPCENSRVLLVTGRMGGGLAVTGWQEREEGSGDSEREETRQGDKEGAGGGNQAPGQTIAPSREAGGRSYNADPGGGSGRTDSRKQNRGCCLGPRTSVQATPASPAEEDREAEPRVRADGQEEPRHRAEDLAGLEDGDAHG